MSDQSYNVFNPYKEIKQTAQDLTLDALDER